MCASVGGDTQPGVDELFKVTAETSVCVSVWFTPQSGKGDPGPRAAQDPDKTGQGYTSFPGEASLAEGAFDPSCHSG